MLPPRDDPVRPRWGGPAGNARLTAWIGLLLLALFVVEGATLLSLNRMIDVHIVVGAALVPIVLLKTISTGWRIVRYYGGSPEYQTAGPPPLLLRLLGPLVVLAGLAVLGTGLTLIALGRASLTPLVAVAGVRIDALTLHQAAFAVWLAATSLHVLARAIPAWRLVRSTRARGLRIPGRGRRAALIVLTLAAAALAGAFALHAGGSWTRPA